MRRPPPLSLLYFLLVGVLPAAPGCGRAPAPAPTPAAPAEAVAEPGDLNPDEPEPAAAPVPPVDRTVAPLPDGYAGRLRARLLRGEPEAVRESLPDGALVAVRAVRGALARADPARRTDALAAVGLIAELFDRRAAFLRRTEAVEQGGTPGVLTPGWAAPVLRAIAAGPATADPATLTDAALLDGTVAALLADPPFRRGLEAWTVEQDVPAVPPAPAATGEGEEEEAVTGEVILRSGERAAVIPVVASGGRWVPVIVEATVPVWAARADTAGGTGAAAALAAARPHLAAAVAADSQGAFDTALREAVTAALAVSFGPPAPVGEGERVTLLLTAPLTAAQIADLLPRLEAATDNPARSVSEAAPRPNDPGWRVSLGPIADPAAWVARTPALVGAAVEGRTVTLAYVPPPDEDGENTEPAADE